MMKFPERPIVSNILIPTIFIVSIFLASLINFANVDALTMSSSRDCDSNAVIKCGALSTSELISRYNSQESVRTIFHNFGITHTDVATINTTAVSGRITAGGRVLVDGKEVASDAMTAVKPLHPTGLHSIKGRLVCHFHPVRYLPLLL
jgi:hypothetical protein